MVVCISGCVIVKRSMNSMVDTARHAPANDRAGARLCGLGDPLLVLPLDRGVRDLKLVEYAHLDVVLQVRQRARHADEADLALLPQNLELIDRGVLFKQ